MKKRSFFIVFVLSLFLFTSCGAKTYSFKKSVDEIESIEIVSARTSLNFTVLKTLSGSEKSDFLERFRTIPFSRYIFGDPMSINGNAVKITYKDGDYEMICPFWSEYVKDGEIYFIWARCDEGEFNQLLEAFVQG